MADVFISYANEDRPRAKTVADALERRGWSVFWDRVIPVGESFHDVIEHAIDEDRLMVLDEGSTIPLGGGRSIDVMYTPGHAKHHVVYLEAETGGCFVGDSVGIAFPHGHMVQPLTPPPDLDPGVLAEQLRRMAAREPAFLGFAHFGVERDPDRSLAEAEERLWDWVRFIRELGEMDTDAAAARLREWTLDGYRDAGYPEDVIATYDKNSFWPMQVGGIQRWLSLQG